jgi:uncharacterized membrane protein YfcA
MNQKNISPEVLINIVVGIFFICLVIFAFTTKKKPEGDKTPQLFSDAWFDEKPLRRLFRRIAIVIFQIGVLAGAIWLWQIFKNGPAH